MFDNSDRNSNSKTLCDRAKIMITWVVRLPACTLARGCPSERSDIWSPGLGGCPPALWPKAVLQRGQISDHLGWEAARLPSGQRLPFREVRYVITWVGRLLACPLARGCPSERSDMWLPGLGGCSPALWPEAVLQRGQIASHSLLAYIIKRKKIINNRTIVHNQYF